MTKSAALLAASLLLFAQGCTGANEDDARDISHYRIVGEYVKGSPCSSSPVDRLHISRDLSRGGSSWLDLHADGSVDAISQPSRILFRPQGSSEDAPWLWVPAKDSDPITTFFFATKIGFDVQLLTPGVEDPDPLWSWAQEQHAEGRLSPVRQIEDDPRSPEVSWVLDDQGQVASLDVKSEDVLPGEAARTRIHRLEAEKVAPLPIVASSSTSPFAEVAALPYVLSLADPGCDPSREMERSDCVEDLVADSTVGEWVESRGLSMALQVTECASSSG